MRATLKTGAIRNRDYPATARAAGATGSVTVQFVVTPGGRASDCRVVRSSGRDDFDTTTCRLIAARYRYDPARDAAGQPVAELRAWKQDWWLED